jgi:pimeloyl-ACP methyl ester carboxylesterase
VVLRGAGHMLISERPDEVLDAVRGLAADGSLIGKS